MDLEETSLSEYLCLYLSPVCACTWMNTHTHR